ncbi:MAG: amidohydrolase family protein [Nitrososphaerota archaeon]|nr:amidohydrolase family protein [Nitrososphaerota archaeon]
MADSKLVIKAGRLFTGNSPSEVIDDATIVVEGGKVKAVYRKDESEAQTGILELDARNYFVMPGLIDVHVHLLFPGNPDLSASMVEQPEYQTIRAQYHASKTLDAGFTTVRDLGASGYEIIALRDAISQRIARGPRIFAAGRILTETGGHGDTPYFKGRVCDGAADCVRATREQIKMTADVIKICVSGGGLSPQDDPRDSQFTREEIAAIATEAHSKRRKVAAHTQSDVGTRNALASGVDTIEHGVRLDEEICKTMIANGNVLVPTMSAPELMVRNQKEEGGLPDWAVRKVGEAIDLHRKSVRLAHDLGVNVALGTDAGTPFNHHGANAGELALLTSFGGFTNGEALYSATHIGAIAVGREDALGSLSEGKSADIIAVKGDPFQDIGSVAVPDNVRLVIKEGNVEKNLDTSFTSLLWTESMGIS